MKIELTVWRTFYAQFKSKFFISGYFNEHHQSWGNSKNYTTGNILYHCVTELETHFTLLYDGAQTYISDATAHDLSFVDPRSALLYMWKVGTDSWNSNHYPITIEYNGTIEPRKGSKNTE
jgi:hypothetical protein